MNIAEGSSVSNVRKADAVTKAAASFLVIFVLFLLPHSCAAATQLTWGGVTYDASGNVVSDDRITIQDGNSYAVPLNVSKLISILNPSYFTVYGMLYLLPDAASSTRTLVGTYGFGAAHTLAWNQAGHYELDVYKATGPVLGQGIWQQLEHFAFGTTAYAQTAPNVIETIHFTITDENSGPLNSNVLFLPGIESSRLYRPDGQGGESRLWEPNGDASASDLALTPLGKSVRSDIYTRDVLDDAYKEYFGGLGIYDAFIASMNTLKSTGQITDWEAVPYDWRLSLDDILSGGNQTGTNISFTQATNTPYIIQELKRLAASSKSGKVTIVAHSNGGLVAKALTEKLGSDASKYIDKIIFVAVPQVGTPAAIAGLLHGYDEGISFSSLSVKISDGMMRTLGGNSPSAYNLIPSANYFTYVDTPVVTFASSMPDWVARYGSTIHSQERLQNFLTDTTRTQPAPTDTKDPSVLNAGLLAQAQTEHVDLDVWVPPAGVQVIQIAGWGVPSTVSGINYSRTGSGNSSSITMSPQFVSDGDGTVVAPSALWITDTVATDYWLNLEDFNSKNENFIQADLHYWDKSHANIFQVPQLEGLISDIITNSQKSLASYIYFSTSTPIANQSDKRLQYALHSPLTLNLYDDQGRHTGVSTTTGMIEEQIPGTYYTEINDVKYIFADEMAAQHIIMSGYATGTFALNVNELQNDAVVASTTFQNIPTTPQTSATISIPSTISSASPLVVDENGDGKSDFTLIPKQNGTVIFDTTPPELRITFATSTDALAFVGTDNQSVPTVTSTTSYPALKKNQKNYNGIATTTVTARDAAGNTTAIVYTEQLPSPAQRDTIVLQALAYNGATTTLASTAVSYKWRINGNNSYKLFASNIRTATSTLESHYRPQKNKTIIMTKPQDLDDSDDDDDSDARPTRQTLPGMVVPFLQTSHGVLTAGYN